MVLDISCGDQTIGSDYFCSLLDFFLFIGPLENVKGLRI